MTFASDYLKKDLCQIKSKDPEPIKNNETPEEVCSQQNLVHQSIISAARERERAGFLAAQ